MSETRDFKICGFCRFFKWNIVITYKLIFFRIYGIFLTLFGCFLPSNTTNKNRWIIEILLNHFFAIFKVSRPVLQLTASPWTTEASTRERWQFGALTNRKATSNNREPSLTSLFASSSHHVQLNQHQITQRLHSTTTRLHYQYIEISEV